MKKLECLEQEFIEVGLFTWIGQLFHDPANDIR